MARFCVVVLLLIGCGGASSSLPVEGGGPPDSGISPVPDSGTVTAADSGTPADAGTADSGPIDAGSPDAGTIDAGSPDAGTIDAGSPDAGQTATLDCGAPGQATLAWSLTGYQNPDNDYLGNNYIALGTDTLDGVLVSHTVLQGHEYQTQVTTYDSDGNARVGVSTSNCGPLECDDNDGIVASGIVYSYGHARSALDGTEIFTINPIPAGAFGSTRSFTVSEPFAANAGFSAFVYSDFKVPSSQVTFVDVHGNILWQKTLPQGIWQVAIDDSGVTLARSLDASNQWVLLAFATDGHVLYTKGGLPNSIVMLEAAGGRFYVGDGTLYSVADGSPLVTVPLAASAGAGVVLTANRLYFVSGENLAGNVTNSVVDAATGQQIFARDSRTTLDFRASGERSALIDPQGVLHLLDAEGNDLLTCQAAADARSPVLLPGGRVAIQRYPNLEVYDVPWPGN